MKCPHCELTTNVFREGDGYLCLTCGSFGDDARKPWDAVLEGMPAREWPAYEDPEAVEQLEFAEMEISG